MKTAPMIFGREPAVWIGVIEAGLALAVAAGLSVTTNQEGLIMAAVTAVFGLYTAWATQDTMLGVLVGLSKALLALGVGFGLHISPELAGAIIAFITVAASAFQRTQTSPVSRSVVTNTITGVPAGPARPLGS